jgi:hypothetical protein
MPVAGIGRAIQAAHQHAGWPCKKNAAGIWLIKIILIADVYTFILYVFIIPWGNN